MSGGAGALVIGGADKNVYGSRDGAGRTASGEQRARVWRVFKRRVIDQNFFAHVRQPTPITALLAAALAL